MFLQLTEPTMVGSLNIGASAREPYYLGQSDELIQAPSAQSAAGELTALSLHSLTRAHL
jgi:hypothetical protein